MEPQGLVQGTQGVAACGCGWTPQQDTHTPTKVPRDQSMMDLSTEEGDSSPEKTRRIEAAGSEGPRGSPACRPNGADNSASCTEKIPLCLDQFQWLASCAQKHGLDTAGVALQRLVDRANAETPKCKRHIFLIVRCTRCLQHTRGGDKRDREIELPEHQWQWLRAVCERSRHSTVGKTIRIIVDFYMPLCQEDPAFEAALMASMGASESVAASAMGA